MTEYASDYRNTSLLFSGMVAIFIGWFAFIAAIFTRYPPDIVLERFLWSTLVVVLSLVAIHLLARRHHTWRIEPDALAIRERPLVPLTGLYRRARIPYAGIAAFEHRENGHDRYLDLIDKGGRRFRLAQALLAPPKDGLSIPQLDPAREILVVYYEIKAAARRGGVTVPGFTRNLGYFSTLPGLFVLAVVFAATVMFAVGVIAALFLSDEGPSGSRAQIAEGIAILIGLPFLTGPLLRKAWRKRREVLAFRAAPSE